VFVLSASPARGASGDRPDNIEHWEDLVRRIADEQGVFVAMAQLVGFEGGKGFPGHSLVMGPRGNVLVAGPIWDEALITATIDLHDLPLARADMPLLADLETMLPHMQREIDRAARHQPAIVGWNAAEQEPAIPPPQALQPAQSSEAEQPPPFAIVSAPTFDAFSSTMLHMNLNLVRRWLVHFLQDEVTRRRGFTDIVLALSGGVDSSLVAFLCAEAFGPDHVTALRMPYRTSSPQSLEHAQLCIDQLGIRSATIDISQAVDAYATLDPEMNNHRKGNIMARMRMIILFDYSQKLGCIPIGTGNKTERLFGYYTWHADDSPPVNPIGDLFKTQVWELARFVGVPSVIVDKPASADLIIGQTDEEDIGITYPQADRILHFALQGYSIEWLVAKGFARQDIELVKKRLDSTHWKRHLPSTAMVSTTAIGEFYLRPLDY
jgi:NAD+ synthetase